MYKMLERNRFMSDFGQDITEALSLKKYKAHH